MLSWLEGAGGTGPSGAAGTRPTTAAPLTSVRAAAVLPVPSTWRTAPSRFSMRSKPRAESRFASPTASPFRARTEMSYMTPPCVGAAGGAANALDTVATARTAVATATAATKRRGWREVLEDIVLAPFGCFSVGRSLHRGVAGYWQP